MLGGVVEFASFTILTLSLASVDSNVGWWIFQYPADIGGLGALIAFIGSVMIAQVVTFILNRKKTFQATNNLAFSITAYAVMVVFIIVAQTYSAPHMLTFFNGIISNPVIVDFLVKAILMFITFIFIFVCSKYVIMRNKKEKV
jgi:putative flippase GtrA